MFNNNDDRNNNNDYQNYDNSDNYDGAPKSVWSADGYGDGPFGNSQNEQPKDDYTPAYVDNSYSNNLGNAFSGLGNNYPNGDEKQNYGYDGAQNYSKPIIESRPVQNRGYDGYGDVSYGAPQYADNGSAQNQYAGENVPEISEQEVLPEITKEELKRQEKQAALAKREEERQQSLLQKEQAKQAKEQAKLDKQAEKDQAKQDKIRQKQQAVADKEQARQQAAAQKEQARQQKEQAKLDANAEKEQAKLDKQNQKEEKKNLKEQAKFEKQNKVEQERQAKEQAKLDKKQAKEQAKLDKKLDKKNKKLKNGSEVQPLADSFEDMNEYQEDTRRNVPEERDMLGGDFISATSASAQTDGVTAQATAQSGYVPKYVSKDVNTILVTLPDKEHMTRKQKKIAKKASRFDEMDLRNYPMTVGKWIGTFIVMLIPLINFIAGICWFFGVGNKSRTAFVRSIFVIWLIITLLLVALLGVGYYFLAQKAQQETGADSFGEVMAYGTDLLCDALSGVVGEETIEPVRQKLKEFFQSLGGTTSASVTDAGSTLSL